MSSASSLKIRTKILLGFSSVLVLTVFLGILAMVQLGRVNKVGSDMATNLLPSTELLSKMNSLVGTARRSELQATISLTKEELDKYETRLDGNRLDFKKEMDAFVKLNLTADEKKQADELSATAERYFEEAKKTFVLCRESKHEEGKTYLRGVSKKSFDAAMKAVGDLISYNEKEGKEAKILINKAYTSALWWVISLLVLAVGIGGVVGSLIAGRISRPVRELAQAAEKVAAGDLNVHIPVAANDEVGQLATSFEVMIENLRQLIGKVSDTSTQVASAANQLLANAEQIATGAEEVAAQAGTVATASEEMSATSGDIARNCQMAAEGGNRATSTATTGAEVVGKTVQVMSRIASRVHESAQTVESLGARSDQIGEIIGTIQDIADQTNLLALNAAIEAARAGEQGRGFAVVADEVRALAERTTKATREIGEMIKAIQNETRSAVTAMEEGVREVENGTDEAAKSGHALQEILEQINAVTMQVNQVATAAEEQTATTGEISNNIHQITEVVHETAKGAQESASAAGQLASLAEDLQRLVRQFKVNAP
ncbi:MAG: HAMP domain-containing protein [Geobacter sp.]|nr:HAMP domain-containing protein [Geobacter sp.]